MRLRITLEDLVADFADALKSIDADRLAHKHFAPDVGPHGETEAVRAALFKLKKIKPSMYADAATKRVPDLLIPGQWAVEFKIDRPFGDNGRPAEHWSENVLHPYDGNTSSLGDCLKLLNSDLGERKAVIIFGYEHTPPRVKLDAAIRGFEVLTREVMGLRLTHRLEESFAADLLDSCDKSSIAPIPTLGSIGPRCPCLVPQRRLRPVAGWTDSPFF